MDAIHYANYMQVEKRYNELADDDMKWYFDSFFELVQKPANPTITWDITIAYLFLKIEQAQRMALYAFMIKKHRINKRLASKVAGSMRLGREDFIRLYETLAEESFCKDANKYYDDAVKTRNKIMHGKSLVHGRGMLFADKADDPERRDAVVFVFEYAVLFNKQYKKIFANKKTNKILKSKPFGKMQGFAAGIKFVDWNKSIDKLVELKISTPKKFKTIENFLKSIGIENQNQ